MFLGRVTVSHSYPRFYCAQGWSRTTNYPLHFHLHIYISDLKCDKTLFLLSTRYNGFRPTVYLLYNCMFPHYHRNHLVLGLYKTELLEPTRVSVLQSPPRYPTFLSYSIHLFGVPNLQSFPPYILFVFYYFEFLIYFLHYFITHTICIVEVYRL